MAALGLIAVLGITACIAPPDAAPPGPLDPRTTMGDGEIRLEWNLTVEGVANGYDVQVKGATTDWRIFTSTPETSAVFTDVVERETYWFRVRTTPVPGQPLPEWGATTSVLYVEPKLPIVRIETNGRAPIIDKDLRLPGTVEIDPNGTDFAAYSGAMEINGRGNSTWTLNKKPYRIRLNSASPLMGMPSNRHWVLLAGAIDRSHLRTFVASELSEATDLAWTPRFRHVEVILNGSYNGVYLLGEHVRPGSNRVPITEMKATDVSGEALTGGYLLERDGWMDQTGDPGFKTVRGEPIVIKEPDPATPEQATYIRNYVNDFENALFSPNFTDPVTGYRAFLDVDSFIDWHLVQEVTRQQDSFFSSTFFYKERGGILTFGPIWDFDQSMGIKNGSVDPAPTGWLARNRGTWTRRLFQDPTFVAAVTERWNELKPAFDQIPARVDALGAELAESTANDALRWWFTPDPTDSPERLSWWLTTRLQWMDENFAG